MEFNLTKHSKHVLRTIEPRSGMEALRALRCGGLITVKQMNDRKQLKGNWTNKCPMCNQVVDRGEDELHLVLFCKRWSAAREEFLLPLVKEGQQKRQRDDNKVRNNLPVIEDKLDIYMMLIGGSNEKYSLLDKEKVIIEEEQKQQWTWYTANFLQSIWSERKTILDTIWQEYGIVADKKSRAKTIWNSAKKSSRRRSTTTEDVIPTSVNSGTRVTDESYDPDMILFQERE